MPSLNVDLLITITWACNPIKNQNLDSSQLQKKKKTFDLDEH